MVRLWVYTAFMPIIQQNLLEPETDLSIVIKEY